MGDYKPDYKGVGEMLCSPEMIAEVARRGEAVKARAIEIAPDAPPYGEGYIEHFSVESGVRVGVTRRAYARVRNDDDKAWLLEKGTKDTPRFRTLGKALDAAGD